MGKENTVSIDLETRTAKWSKGLKDSEKELKSWGDRVVGWNRSLDNTVNVFKGKAAMDAVGDTLEGISAAAKKGAEMLDKYRDGAIGMSDAIGEVAKQIPIIRKAAEAGRDLGDLYGKWRYGNPMNEGDKEAKQRRDAMGSARDRMNALRQWVNAGLYDLSTTDDVKKLNEINAKYDEQKAVLESLREEYSKTYGMQGLFANVGQNLDLWRRKAIDAAEGVKTMNEALLSTRDIGRQIADDAREITDGVTADARARAEATKEATKTVLEKYRERIDELKSLREQGLISDEVFGRAAGTAGEELNKQDGSGRDSPAKAVTRRFNFATPGQPKQADPLVAIAKSTAKVQQAQLTELQRLGTKLTPKEVTVFKFRN